jgi:hypothetical protein
MSTVEEPVLAEVVPTSWVGFGDPIGVQEKGGLRVAGWAQKPGTRGRGTWRAGASRTWS